jgi:hypothetical protein
MFMSGAIPTLSEGMRSLELGMGNKSRALAIQALISGLAAKAKGLEGDQIRGAGFGGLVKGTDEFGDIVDDLFRDFGQELPASSAGFKVFISEAFENLRGYGFGKGIGSLEGEEGCGANKGFRVIEEFGEV